MPDEPSGATLPEVLLADDDVELPAAPFAAPLVDEWHRQGVRHAVVCPGSRSTPLAVALADHGGIAVHVHVDERSGGFMALGLARGTGVPAVVLTTSGTAAVELHPAVVEADHGGVPLLAVTADRPPELRGVGAPQTIDQRDLYGPSVRWRCDPGPPDPRRRAEWRHLAADAVAATRGVVPGPVHLNLAFREPLVGRRGDLPAADPSTDRPPPPALELLEEQVARLAVAMEGKRGIVVAGTGAARDDVGAEVVGALAETLGWPLVADHLSGCRRGGPSEVRCADSVLRIAEVADELRPDVVLRIGGLLASRVTNEWLAASGATQFALDDHGRAPDPDGVVGERFHAPVTASLGALVARLRHRDHPPDVAWRSRWREVEQLAARAVDATLARHGELTEPGAAKAALSMAPAGGALVVASSMPVRDLEWYVPGRRGIGVVANRGANGIDGVVSTAVGVALGGRPVVALVGDLAFLHDSNALIGLARRGVDLCIVVVDNDGGGIFSFLPQAGALDPARFEQLFGTPHGVDLGAIAGAHGIGATTVSSQAGLESALVGWRDRRGVQLIVARSDRARNVELHHELNAAVAAALAPPA
jgi:2-succinyl-5-enolpyruvyl-6-hydroxy-3-cyclohexene-1-carboxylate synthase